MTGKNFLTLMGAVAVFAETLIALLVPADHLGWFRWRVAIIMIGVLGIAALIWQTLKQSREDNEREQREKNRDDQIRWIKDAIHAIQPESKYQELTVTQITDPGSGEERKAAALHAPILKSHIIRSHLMPRSPWQALIEGVFKATGRTEYEVETDFLYELFLVNTTENQVTLKISLLKSR